MYHRYRYGCLRTYWADKGEDSWPTDRPISSGHNVVGPTVVIGQEKVDELVREVKRPLEELTAQQRESIALLREKLGLNERQVPSSSKLLSASRTFTLPRQVSPATVHNSRPESGCAGSHYCGELDKADALFAHVETEQRDALDRFVVNAAETSARRGDIALT
jgi:hypothetical protein